MSHPCGTRPVYSERWDAYYCPGCDEWMEPVCQDPGCDLCSSRPERPSEAGAK